MSDLLGLHLCFQVSTPDGDVSVSDSCDGDQALRALVSQYPDATVIPIDRDTGKALGDALPLIRLLQHERGFVWVDVPREDKP